MDSVLRWWLELEQVGAGQAFFSSYDLGASPGGLVGLPLSMAASGQWDCLQGGSGLHCKCSGEKSRSYVTFYDPA